MELYMNFTASSTEELKQKIFNLSIVVPPRGKLRTTELCEQWQIHHYLLALLQLSELKIPFELKKRERPDFEVVNGTTTIGIEATEIINPDYARAITLPEAKSDVSVIDPSHFKWGNSGRSLDELRNTVTRDKLTGTPWCGQSVEVEFTKSVIDTVNAKHSKFINGFKRYASNVLLAYHNNSTPILDFDIATNLTRAALSNYWKDNGFDTIVIHKYKTLMFFTKSSSFSVQVQS